MNDDPKLASFKRKMLIFPPLLIAIVNLPMALGLIPPNRIYGFRTSASLASSEVWYRSNMAAGITALVLGLAAPLIVREILKRGPITVSKALLWAGLMISIVLASFTAGVLACA